MDTVRCEGDEVSLLNCSFDSSDDCGSSEGAGVVCKTGSTTPTTQSNTLRLVGGSASNEGNLIITRPDGFTGPVCDDTFNHGDNGIRQVNLAS